MPEADPRLVQQALRALGPPGVRVGAVDEKASGRSGLYAIFGSPTTWRQLALGVPPDERPLYVGKAESTLAARDLAGHFGMRPRQGQSPTGSSTIRRSLAALLAHTAGYRGVPRNPERPSHFSNFGLSPAQDEELSAWMRRRLSIALWPHSDARALDLLETQVLKVLVPPLNLNKVETPWRRQVQEARGVLKRQAEDAAAVRDSR
jgi:hypothetical protein